VKHALFEGPFSEKLAGWRHYMLWAGDKRATFLALPTNAWRMAERLNAVYYREGTWEAVTLEASAAMASEGRFAEVSPALLPRLERTPNA
jgi:hypothetical protein